MRDMTIINEMLETLGEAPEEEIPASILPKFAELVGKDPEVILKGLKAITTEYAGAIAPFTKFAISMVIEHLEE